MECGEFSPLLILECGEFSPLLIFNHQIDTYFPLDLMDPNALRVELVETICRLPDDNLQQAAQAIRELQKAHAIIRDQASEMMPASSVEKHWPHAPLHRLAERGTYIVTTGTLHKQHLFHDPDRLTFLECSLLSLARKHQWQLEAWAVFSNHYHFVGHALASPSGLKELMAELHSLTALEINGLDGVRDRQVWHNFWETQLTYEKSYLARLNYVHHNAVKHGLVPVANQYPWCSAAWFERTARPAQVKTIYSFKINNVKVADEYEPLAIQW
jgi:putative transposase